MTDIRAINADGEIVPFPNAEQVVTLRAQVHDLEEERDRLNYLLGLAQKDVRQKQQTISKLTGERNADRGFDAFNDVIEVWFDRWFEVCVRPDAKGNKRPRQLGDKRWKAAHARAADPKAPISEEDGLKAVDGAALLWNEQSMKPHMRDMMLEFEYIFRHETHVDRFIKDWERAQVEEKNEADLGAFSTESVEKTSTSTLHLVPEVPVFPEVWLPAWPVECARHTSPCDHRRMLRGTWSVWRAAGFSGCPGCGGDVIGADGQRSEPWDMRMRTVKRKEGSA